jgi:hypothetical protein
LAIARGISRALWIPWRAAASLLRCAAADTMLGIFRPLGLVAILLLLSSGVVPCLAGLHWGVFTELGSHRVADFGGDPCFGAGAFFIATDPATPIGGAGEVLQIAEAATALGFLAMAIGYLPARYQAFARREAAVARPDARAGSPPSAGRLPERSAQLWGWAEVDECLLEWETWTAELMATHLSYPILGYFRSQHVNQNWLAALTTIVDAWAHALVCGPDDSTQTAELTFRIGSHALAGPPHAVSTRRFERDPEPRSRERIRSCVQATSRTRSRSAATWRSTRPTGCRLADVRGEWRASQSTREAVVAAITPCTRGRGGEVARGVDREYENRMIPRLCRTQQRETAVW